MPVQFEAVSPDWVAAKCSTLRILYSSFNQSPFGAKFACFQFFTAIENAVKCMLSLGQSLRPRDLIGASLSQPLATFLPSVPPFCFSLQTTEQTALNPSFTHVGGRLSWRPGQGAPGFTSASLAASSQVPGSQGH